MLAKCRRFSSGIATPEQQKAIVETLDLDFAYAYEKKARFRANYFYKVTGLAAVFRTIPAKVLTLEDLKCPAAIRKLSERQLGAGPGDWAHRIGASRRRIRWPP